MEKITFKDLGNRWIEELAKTKAPGTVARYQVDLRILNRFFGEETDIQKISQQKVVAFRKSEILLTKAGNVKGFVTVDRTIRVVRFLFRFAVEKGFLKSSPVPNGYNAPAGLPKSGIMAEE